MTRQLLVWLFTLSIQHQVQQTRACGGVYTSPSGSISSPLYPSQYPPNEDCTYIINTTQGHRITLTFVTFDIEAATNSCDCLQIRDGSSEHSPSMGIFCNTAVPDKVRSTSNTMWIRFSSDSSKSGTGFNATYSSAIIPQKFLLVTDLYNGIHRIDIDTGSNVTILPSGLQNPFGIDYDPVDGRIYWSNAQENTIRSANLDGSVARLVRNISRGRRLYWADVGTQLIGWTDLNDRRSGVFFKQRGSHFVGLDIYQNELFVTDWGPELLLAETTHIYRFAKNGTKSATVQVNGRVNDVRVYAEEGTHKASTSPAPATYHTIRSESTESIGAKTLNIILVGVIIALVVTAGIATLIVCIKKKKYCGGIFAQPSGSISSPLYPGNYPKHQDCIYLIQAIAGHRVTLKFVFFELESGSTSSVCDHDYVQIRDGGSVASPSLGIYCNTTIRPKVRSTRNVMWIKFHSDSLLSKTGFEATYTTGIIPQKFLLMTNTHLHAIHRMDLDTGSNFIIPIDGLQNPIAVDYDPVDGRLYWTDVVEKTIRSSDLDGSDLRLVRNLGPKAVPDGLAVDSLSRLIVYTDTGNDVIAMIAMNSYNHKVVVHSNLDEPRAIELDKRRGVMYWSDWGATPKIERANYDGTGRKTLVSGFQYLHWPNALALDTVAGRVYWADGYTRKIGWTDVEGTVVSIVVSLSVTHKIFGLDLYLNYLFVTDWGVTSVQPITTYIHRISADGTNRKTIGVFNGRLNDIHIYSEELDDNDPNGCGNNNGGCHYICVPAPGNTSQCLYPDGLVTGPVITSVATSTKRTTLNDIRITGPIISVTPDGQKVTAGSNRFAAAVNKVLAAKSKVPSDLNTVTPSISRVNTGVTNLSGDISKIYGSEAPSISPQLIILVIGCIVVSVTVASCVTFIIVYKRKKRDRNRHTTAVRSSPEADPGGRTDEPPTDTVSADYLTPVAADVNYEDEEHIYHELHTIDGTKAMSQDSGDYLKLTK